MRALLAAGRLLVRAGRRFLADEGATRAAALTYTTLLSLVPFLAVFFAVLSAFDAFLRPESRLETFLLDHLLPGSAAAAIEYLTRFTEKTAAVGAVGFAALLTTSLLLLGSIEGAFRYIHRLPEGRSLRQRLLSYWTMLTPGPVEAPPARPRPAPGPLAARLLWLVARDFALGRERPTVEGAAEALADAVRAGGAGDDSGGAREDDPTGEALAAAEAAAMAHLAGRTYAALLDRSRAEEGGQPPDEATRPFHPLTEPLARHRVAEGGAGR